MKKKKLYTNHINHNESKDLENLKDKVITEIVGSDTNKKEAIIIRFTDGTELVVGAFVYDTIYAGPEGCLSISYFTQKKIE